MAVSTTFITHSAQETQNLGKSLGKHLKEGDLLCLVGDVGAGKTTLIQGMAQGLGVKKPVQSPTFVLAHEYTPTARSRAPGTLSRTTPKRRGAPLGRHFTLIHMDFFRLQPKEILSTGWEDFLTGPNAVVVEWADIGRELWPQEFFEIRIERVSDAERKFDFLVQGQRYDRLITAAHAHFSR